MNQYEQVAAKSFAHSIAGRSPHLFGSGYSVLAQLRLSRRAPPEIRLHPLTLGPDRSRTGCGYPRLADGPLAEGIIKLLRDLCAPFGTTVVARDGAAVVVP